MAEKIKWTKEKPQKNGIYLLARLSEHRVTVVESIGDETKSKEMLKFDRSPKNILLPNAFCLRPRKEDWWFGPINSLIPDPFKVYEIRKEAGWVVNESDPHV